MPGRATHPPIGGFHLHCYFGFIHMLIYHSWSTSGLQYDYLADDGTYMRRDGDVRHPILLGPALTEEEYFQDYWETFTPA